MASIPKTQTPTNVADVIAKAEQAGQQATQPPVKQDAAGVTPEALMKDVAVGGIKEFQDVKTGTTGEQVKPLTTRDVLGEANVEQALTEPVGQPDLVEPAPEVSPLEAKKQNLANLMNTINVTTQVLSEQNVGAFGTTGASQNLIGRQIQSYEQSQINKIEALQYDISIAEEAAAKIENLMQRNVGAGISPDDSFEEAIRKSAEYQLSEEARRATTEEERIIRGETRGEERQIRGEDRAYEKQLELLEKQEESSLKSMALSLGINPKGSAKSLAKKIAKQTSKGIAMQDRMNELTLQAKEDAFAKTHNITPASPGEPPKVPCYVDGTCPEGGGTTGDGGGTPPGNTYVTW